MVIATYFEQIRSSSDVPEATWKHEDTAWQQKWLESGEETAGNGTPTTFSLNMGRFLLGVCWLLVISISL